jgi:hypothetical protein
VVDYPDDKGGGGGGGSFVNSLLNSATITLTSTPGNGSAGIIPPIGGGTTFNSSGVVQTYTTPVSGTYTLIAVGACGGTGFPDNAGGFAV